MFKKFLCIILFLIFFSISNFSENAWGKFSTIDTYFYNPIVLNVNELLVLGGYDSFKNKPVSAKIYNLDTKSFMDTHSVMSIPRISYNSIQIDKNKILVFGGQPKHKDYRGLFTKTAEIFDLNTKKFRRIGDTNFIHIKPSIILLDDGRIFINSQDKPEIFNPKTETFSIVGRKKEEILYAFGDKKKPMKFSFYTLNHYSQSTAVKLQDGKILIVGGFPYENFYNDKYCDKNNRYYNKNFNAEIYDPKANNFIKIGQMNRQCLSCTATLLPDGTVLIAGGKGRERAEVFSPKTNTFFETGKMKQPRYNHSSILLSTGSVLIIGGIYGEDKGMKYVKVAELYNSKTKKFRKVGFTKEVYPSSKMQVIDKNRIIITNSKISEIYKY